LTNIAQVTTSSEAWCRNLMLENERLTRESVEAEEDKQKERTIERTLGEEREAKERQREVDRESARVGELANEKERVCKRASEQDERRRAVRHAEALVLELCDLPQMTKNMIRDLEHVLVDAAASLHCEQVPCCAKVVLNIEIYAYTYTHNTYVYIHMYKLTHTHTYTPSLSHPLHTHTHTL